MHMQMTRAVFVAQTLALILAEPLCVPAEDKSHVTSEQVTRAIQEIEKLAQGQIQKNALPGLAIAVVFQDKVVKYARRARCDHKIACRRGYGVSACVAVQADRLDGSC